MKVDLKKNSQNLNHNLSSNLVPSDPFDDKNSDSSLLITKEERDAQTKVVTSEDILKSSDTSADELNNLFETAIFNLDAKRIAIISDMHSNQTAFEAVLEDMKKYEFDTVVCLGDLVGYYTKPNEVVEKAREISDVTVIGNHDFALIEPHKLLYTTLQEGAQAALDYNQEVIKNENKKWLSSLPMKAKIYTPYASLTLVHGDPVTIFGYIYGITPELFEQSILQALNNIDTDYLLVGHSHLQGEYYSSDNKIYVNPGAIGQPRDHDNRAAYAIIDLETRKNQLIRVSYDIDEVVADVIDCCLPDYLAHRLRKGE